MKYRIELDASFDLENDAISFLNLIEKIKDKIFTGTGNESIPIIHTCRYHKCFHDETPPSSCGGYVNVDLSDGVPLAHKNSSDVVIKADVVIPEDVKTDIKNS